MIVDKRYVHCLKNTSLYNGTRPPMGWSCEWVTLLNPDIKMHILLTVLHEFLWTSKENLSKSQDILPLVITFFILINWMFEQVVIMLRETSFSSLLRGNLLKGSRCKRKDNRGSTINWRPNNLRNDRGFSLCQSSFIFLSILSIFVGFYRVKAKHFKWPY